MTESPEISLAAAIANLGTTKFKKHVVDWLDCCVPSDNMTWLAYFQSGRPKSLFARNSLPEVHRNFDSVYLAGAYLLDPFHDLHIKEAERGVYRLTEIAPDKFHSNQYFTEYYSKTSLIDEIAFVSYPNPGVSIHICLGRDATSNQRFTSRTITEAKRIALILSALVETHWADLNTTGEYEEAQTTAKLIHSVHAQLGIQLSPRQAEVAMLILRGHSSVSIGLRLEISFQTVKVFRKQLYKKCKISSQAELFKLLLPLLGH